MKKTSFETIKDIAEMLRYDDDIKFIDMETSSVDDISVFTENHYKGPGQVLKFWVEAARWGEKWDDIYMVFDNDDNFVGLKREDYFDDIDKDWWKK